MKYNRPHVHIYTDVPGTTHEVSIIVPLENDYDSVTSNINVLESGVEIIITLGEALGSNVHAEKFGPNSFKFSAMPSLLVEVQDHEGATLGKFFTDDPESDGDKDPTDELSHFVYLNQPPGGGDYQLHVLIDIEDIYRNTDTSGLGLKDNGDGSYTLEIEEENDPRDGLPLEGSISFGGSNPVIEVEAEDVSASRKRGPKKLKIQNRDIRL